VTASVEKYATSTLAVSGPSEPCTALAPIDLAKRRDRPAAFRVRRPHQASKRLALEDLDHHR
jgi:hypothetical protein